MRFKAKVTSSTILIHAGTHVPDVDLLSAVKNVILCILKPDASNLSPELHGCVYSQTCKHAPLQYVKG